MGSELDTDASDEPVRNDMYRWIQETMNNYVLTAALDYLKYSNCMAQKRNPYQVAAVEDKIKATRHDQAGEQIDKYVFADMMSDADKIADDLAANNYFESLDGKEPYTILSNSNWEIWLAKNQARYYKNQAVQPKNQAKHKSSFLKRIRNFLSNCFGLN